MFHKTIHKAWNLFKLSEQLLENFTENLVLQLSIDRVLFFDRLNKNQIAIDSSRDSRIIFLPFQSIEPKLQPIEHA